MRRNCRASGDSRRSSVVSPGGVPVDQAMREHLGLHVRRLEAEVSAEFSAQEVGDLRGGGPAVKTVDQQNVEAGVLIVRPAEIGSDADGIPFIQQPLKSALVMRCAQLLQDSLDSAAMNAVIELQFHRLDCAAKRPPNSIRRALGQRDTG